VSQLLECEVVFKCGDTELYENLKGIPLTEERLLKFRFKKRHSIYPVPHGSYSFEIEDVMVLYKMKKGFHYGIEDEIDGCNISINLYFALTGNELKIVESE